MSKTNKNIFEVKKRLDKIFKSFLIYDLDDENLDIISNLKIQQNLNQSEAIIIQVIEENKKNDIFFICFKNTVIITNKDHLKALQEPIFNSSKLPVFILPKDTENKFRENIKIQDDQIKSNYYNFELEEIKSFQDTIKDIILFPSFDKIIQKKYITKCISGYLIQESYAKINKNQKCIYNQIIEKGLNTKSSRKNNFEIEEFDKNDFINLNTIGNGSSSLVDLSYHIEKRELFVIKNFNKNYSKLIDREIQNYEKIDFPLLPKFYGKIKNSNSLVIQFINGRTLLDIEENKLKGEDSIFIIFELILIIEYLHEKHFVYRDLKPNNVIIDENKNIYVIDFDRMVNIDDNTNDANHTADFGSGYIAPEVNSGQISYKNDIYSLGKMIEYIIKHTEGKEIKDFFYLIIAECTDKCIEERPYIWEIKEDILLTILKLGLYYLEDEYITRDINKALHYLSLVANQNHLELQYILGNIYSTGIYITRDFNKSIHYFSLAANQNHPIAQYKLGALYCLCKYITQDINKSIHYLSLASNQNIPEAQLYLGNIYYFGEYITRDINKAIYYFSLVANQNDSDAQFMLGYIYYSGEYITRDINKAFHYFSLAANQNHPAAQLYLGYVYYFGEYITRDINKSIYYLSLASNQNDPDAQFKLGLIYHSGEYITRDINKAIHYLSLASNQNHANSQFVLGLIYYEGEYITRDINKAFHYFSLASNHNDPKSQYILGLTYIEGIYIEKNMIKGIDLLIQSSSNKFKEAHFVVGYLYHEGKYVSRDMKKAIHYYKEGSTFNDEYAKNNLGIIYKNGIENEIERNIGLSMSYFEEAIRRFNNKVSMHNMAHIYIYEDQTPERINESIKLLINSINKNFNPSIVLLCIALIKKHGLNLQNIMKELQNQTKQYNDLYDLICEIIINENFKNEKTFESFYQYYKKIDYLYDFNHDVIKSTSINEPIIIQTKSNVGTDITSDFYEGFSGFKSV